MGDEFDYSELAPGIRETVRLLRSNGFETTDSGDGVANVESGIEGAMDIPMVACATSPLTMAGDADRLWELVRPLCEGSPDVRVEASYSPNDGVALLLLLGFDDTFLR
jgi:hypothetical protein